MKHIKITSISKYPIINIDVKESNGNVYMSSTNQNVEEFTFITENCLTIKIKDDITFIYDNIKYSIFDIVDIEINENLYTIYTSIFEIEYLG